LRRRKKLTQTSRKRIFVVKRKEEKQEEKQEEKEDEKKLKGAKILLHIEICYEDMQSVGCKNANFTFCKDKFQPKERKKRQSKI
jgi:hypothetical protein